MFLKLRSTILAQKYPRPHLFYFVVFWPTFSPDYDPSHAKSQKTETHPNSDTKYMKDTNWNTNKDSSKVGLWLILVLFLIYNMHVWWNLWFWNVLQFNIKFVQNWPHFVPVCNVFTLSKYPRPPKSNYVILKTPLRHDNRNSKCSFSVAKPYNYI